MRFLDPTLLRTIQIKLAIELHIEPWIKRRSPQRGTTKICSFTIGSREKFIENQNSKVNFAVTPTSAFEMVLNKKQLPFTQGTGWDVWRQCQALSCATIVLRLFLLWIQPRERWRSAKMTGREPQGMPGDCDRSTIGKDRLKIDRNRLQVRQRSSARSG